MQYLKMNLFILVCQNIVALFRFGWFLKMTIWTRRLNWQYVGAIRSVKDSTVPLVNFVNLDLSVMAKGFMKGFDYEKSSNFTAKR